MMVGISLADYFTISKKYPVRSQVEPGYLEKLVPSSAPNQPETLEKILGRCPKDIFPGLTHWQSPNFFAYFPCISSTAGILGEMLSAGLNVAMVVEVFYKAVKISGIKPENFRASPTTKATEFALCPESLSVTIQEDIKVGLIPLFLCATIGTTSTTAVDPLKPLCEIAKQYGIWVHVDAAYAGSACICPEFQHFLDGVENANSFSLNAHKWLFSTLDSCCLWVKDSNSLTKALTTTPECLRNKATDSKLVLITKIGKYL
ncbi:hypothetical protein HAX54_027995 [Datura stramonium]|uniref:Tyrosine decarboxylase n=1 Tax=Datura stramonium TaxID=4076 RepID=A0ABS8S968_DATST|nr:hypothetical protein [Datura stramonium]